jgi:hypothetical protein
MSPAEVGLTLIEEGVLSILRAKRGTRDEYQSIRDITDLLARNGRMATFSEVESALSVLRRRRLAYPEDNDWHPVADEFLKWKAIEV